MRAVDGLSFFLTVAWFKSGRQVDVLAKVQRAAHSIGLGYIWSESDDGFVSAVQSPESSLAEGRIDVGALKVMFPSADGSDVRHGVRTPKTFAQRCVPEFDRLFSSGNPSALLGSCDFAGTICHAERSRVFAVRDRIGMMPIYWSVQPSGFWVSNSLSWLVSTLSDRADINVRRLVRKLLSFGDEGLIESDYDGIFRVPAGHVLMAEWRGDRWSTKLAQYFALGSKPAADVSVDPRENAEILRDRLRAAVRARIPVSGRVGIELSGGLDSSAVSGLAAEEARDRVLTFSAVYPGIPESDEKVYIDAAVRHQGIHNHQFSALDLDVGRAYLESLDASGVFHLAGNIFVNDHILKLVRQSGSRVVLNGIDGDNVIAHGFGALQSLASARKWGRFGQELRAVSDIYEHLADNPRRSLFESLGRSALDEQSLRSFGPTHFSHILQISRLTGIPLRRLARRSLALRLLGAVPTSQHSGMSALKASLLRSDLLDEVVRQSGPLVPSLPRSHETERERQLSTLRHGVTEYYFELAQPLAARAGISLRCPFMDVDVIEFGLSIPPEHNLREGWNRWVLRRGLEPQLGPEIAWRRWKSNLTPGHKRFVRARVVPELNDWTQSPDLPVWDLFDRKAVTQRLGLQDSSLSDMDSWRLWTVWAAGSFVSRVRQWQQCSDSGGS